ncbi:MAG: Two-component transcriptional response regulator, LuxR family, partial [uncultured Solirubrobacteraceae bacterium]
ARRAGDADGGRRRRGVGRGAAGPRVGRERRPLHQHGPHDRDDPAPQAGLAGRAAHGARRRLPTV